MSRRHLVSKYPVWTNLDSSASVPSVSTVVDQVDNIKYSIQIDPSVQGELFVEFLDNKTDGGAEWLPLDFATSLILNGASETYYTVLLTRHVAKNMRLNFVNNGGTGLINAWYASSSVGL